MSAYRLHEVLVSQARPTAGLKHLFLGITLIFFGFVFLSFAYFQILQQFPDWPSIHAEWLGGTSARALWLMLLHLALLLLVLGFVVQEVHKRSLASLLGPRLLVSLDFRRVLRPLVILFTIIFFIPSPEGFEPIPNMASSAWALLLPLSLPLILLQVSAEELVFRGYIQSQLAARFNSPLVWMVAPSLLFGALHYDPVTYGPNAIYLAAWTVLFALAAADLTARSGNLGPALALHFANNVSALMLTSMQDHWDGLALYVLPFGPEAVETIRAMIPVEVLVILCCWLVARIAIRR